MTKIRERLRTLVCRFLGHRWRTSMSTTHIVTGAGEREEYCARCRERWVVTIPARHQPGDDR